MAAASGPGRDARTAVGLTGTVLVAWPTLGEGSSSVTGVLLILLAVASYGFALNIARPLQHQYGALPVIWRAQAVALLLTAPLGLRDVLAAHWSLAPALSMMALGALGTGVAFVVAAIAAGRFGATAASATAFLIPTVALVSASRAGERVRCCRSSAASSASPAPGSSADRRS